MTVRVAVLTVSDACAAGNREDISGALAAEWAIEVGFDLVQHRVVPDDALTIASQLAFWSDGDLADVVLTTGGTGLAPRDVTPEATRSVLDREAPGISEALRATVRAAVPMASLGRGVAGCRGATLIVNLPGSPAGVKDGLAVLFDLIPHAVALLGGDTEH